MRGSSMAPKHKFIAVSLAALATALGLGLQGQACAQAATGGGSGTSTNSAGAGDASSNGADAYNPVSYDRGGNVSVLQRERPDYKALGLHLGGFTVYPKLDANLVYDDNIFAVQTGAVGDAIVTVAPEIAVQSNWSRNGLSGRVWARQDWYTRYSSDDATEYGVDLAGKLELGRSILTAGVSSGLYALARSSSVNIGQGFSENRTDYVYTTANTQLVHEFNRLRLTARFDYQDYSYQNGKTNTGQVVFNEGLNHQAEIYSGKAEYAITPDAAVFLNAVGNHQQYGANPMEAFTRSSSGFEVDAGGNFDLTHLVRGEFQFGFIEQDYVSPVFKSISGPSLKGKLEWFATQLTTVTLEGARTIADSIVPNSAGYTASSVKLEVDHELLRNLILSANAGYEQDGYNGIDRNDDHTNVDISANWLINRWLGLTFAYSYSDQRSYGVVRGPGFSDNRGSVSTVLQF
jgi:hypothetical protein